MRGKFRLREIGVTLFHGHAQDDSLESRVTNGRQDLFNKTMKAMKVKNG